MEKTEIIQNLVEDAQKLELPTIRQVSFIIENAKILAKKFFGKVNNNYLITLNGINSLRLKRSRPKKAIRKKKHLDSKISYRVEQDLLLGLKLKDTIDILNLMIKDIESETNLEDKIDINITKNEFDISNIISDKFINLNFQDYDLVHYNIFVDLINESAKSNKFFIIVPFLLRNLCENMLYDIFLKSLDNSNKELYFLKGRRRDFSQLISLLNLLKEKEFKAYHKIDQGIITFLKEVQKIGNLTVHEIIRQIDTSFITSWKEKIERLILNLLVLYKKVPPSGIKIMDNIRISNICDTLRIQLKSRNLEQDYNTLTSNLKEGTKSSESHVLILYNTFSKKNNTTKGKLISIIREFGKTFFNKYLNMEFIDRGEIIQLINETWRVIIYGPSIKKPYRFSIHCLELVENNIYRDNPKDSGNLEILSEFLKYLSINLKILKKDGGIY